MSEVLRVLAAGPLPAVRVAELAGLSIEDAYTHLVAAESRGLVRVNVDTTGRERKEWELMEVGSKW